MTSAAAPHRPPPAVPPSAPPSAPRTTPFTAFLVACGGVALFSLMDAAMKGLALGLGAYNALLWRHLAGLLIGGLLFFGSRAPMPGRAALIIHVKRGVIVAAMAMLFFWSLIYLPLAEAIALSFIAPLIALYLASVLLGEQIGRAAIAASLLGLAGVGVIMAGRLGGGGSHGAMALWAVLAVLGSAVLFAYNLILARQQAQIAKPIEITFFQSLTVCATLGLFAPWFLVVPAPAYAPLIIAAGALAVLSILLLSWAYARAEAQVLIPVEYTAFVWAAICGWVFFGEPLRWPTIAGTLLIVTGCLIAARSKPAQPLQVEEAFA